MNPAVAPSSHSTQPADKIYPLTTQASFVSQMHICLYSHICLTMHYNTHPHGTRACLSPSSLFIPTCRHLLTCTHHIYLCTHPFVPAFVSISKSVHPSLCTSLPFYSYPRHPSTSGHGQNRVLSVQVVNRVLMITVELIQQVVEDIMAVGGW